MVSWTNRFRYRELGKSITIGILVEYLRTNYLRIQIITITSTGGETILINIVMVERCIRIITIKYLLPINLENIS